MVGLPPPARSNPLQRKAGRSPTRRAPRVPRQGSPGAREIAVGPVIRALLSQIAVNTGLGDPSPARVVLGRRDQVRDVIARGVARGDLQPDVNAVRLSVDL
jgi:hypothetical protein